MSRLTNDSASAGERRSMRMARLAEPRGLTIILFAVLCWVMAGFALADPELSPTEFLGGAKVLFVVFAVLMTLIAGFNLWRLRSARD